MHAAFCVVGLFSIDALRLARDHSGRAILFAALKRPPVPAQGLLSVCLVCDRLPFGKKRCKVCLRVDRHGGVGHYG